jgi:hypothetical protein
MNMRPTLPMTLMVLMLSMSACQTLPTGDSEQNATIRVRASGNAYFVQTTISESRSTDRQGVTEVLAAPEISVQPGEWSGISVCDTNAMVTFDVHVSSGDEVVKISHGPGVCLRIKVSQTKRKNIVHVQGVLSAASSGPGDPRASHRVIPFDFNCPLEKETAFYRKAIAQKER